MAGLRVIEGTPADFDAEWDVFWRAIATTAGEAINDVSPDHPEYGAMQAVTRDARAAARLHPVGRV